MDNIRNDDDGDVRSVDGKRAPHFFREKEELSPTQAKKKRRSNDDDDNNNNINNKGKYHDGDGVKGDSEGDSEDQNADNSAARDAGAAAGAGSFEFPLRRGLCHASSPTIGCGISASSVDDDGAPQQKRKTQKQQPLPTSSDEKGPARSARSEKKRRREKCRRTSINQGFEELMNLLVEIDPGVRAEAERRWGMPSTAQSSASGFNRVHLINRTVEVLTRVFLENEQRKQTIQQLLVLRSGGFPPNAIPTTTAAASLLLDPQLRQANKSLSLPPSLLSQVHSRSSLEALLRSSSPAESTPPPPSMAYPSVTEELLAQVQNQNMLLQDQNELLQRSVDGKDNKNWSATTTSTNTANNPLHGGGEKQGRQISSSRTTSATVAALRIQQQQQLQEHLPALHRRHLGPAAAASERGLQLSSQSSSRNRISSTPAATASLPVLPLVSRSSSNSSRGSEINKYT